jgi:hypothetical protein
MSKVGIMRVSKVPEGTWVWCLHCEQCYKVGEFQAGLDGLRYCPYAGCDGDAVLDANEWEDMLKLHPDYDAIPERGKVYPM